MATYSFWHLTVYYISHSYTDNELDFHFITVKKMIIIVNHHEDEGLICQYMHSLGTHEPDDLESGQGPGSCNTLNYYTAPQQKVP